MRNKEYYFSQVEHKGTQRKMIYTKDHIIEKIKEVIESIVKGKIILFGSRAKGVYQEDSDYDILIIISENINPKEKIKLSSIVSKNLAKLYIDADVIVENEKEVEEKKQLIGNIIKYAMQEGIKI